MNLFTDIVKGMANGAEAIQENFSKLAKSIIDIKEDGTMSVDSLEVKNLDVANGIMKKVGTFQVSSEFFKPTTDGNIYQSGNMYMFEFSNTDMNIQKEIKSGTWVTADVKLYGVDPSGFGWVTAPAATNSKTANVECQFTTGTNLRVKVTGSSLTTSTYFRVANVIAFKG